MSETGVPSGNWRVKSRFADFGYANEVAIFKGDFLVRLTFEPYARDTLINEPTVRDFTEEQSSFLRAALNCAWELGLRPDGFDDTRESMKATVKHLEDMRALAFHKIGANKPT